MIIEYIRYKVAEDKREAFEQAYIKASKQLDISDFCKSYELTECSEEPGQYILRIEWTSVEDHLGGFRKSDVFPLFFSNIKGFYNDIQEMRHYKLTPVSNKK